MGAEDIQQVTGRVVTEQIGLIYHKPPILTMNVAVTPKTNQKDSKLELQKGRLQTISNHYRGNFKNHSKMTNAKETARNLT